MRKAAQQDLAQWDAYGPLLVTKQLVGVSGQCIPMMFVNLLTLLHACYKQGGFPHDLVQRTVARTGAPSPQKPWSLCLYSDECWPANPLSHKSEKKLWVSYATFKEFGSQYVSSQNSWLLVMVARSSLVAEVEGNMGQIMKEILLGLFCSRRASPLDNWCSLAGPQHK